MYSLNNPRFVEAGIFFVRVSGGVVEIPLPPQRARFQEIPNNHPEKFDTFFEL